MGNNVRRITKQKWCNPGEIVFKDNTYYILDKSQGSIDYKEIKFEDLEKRYFCKNYIQRLKGDETYFVKNELLKTMDFEKLELKKEKVQKKLGIFYEEISEELDDSFLDNKVIKISNIKSEKNDKYLDKVNKKYSNNKCFVYEAEEGNKINVRYMYKGEYGLIKSRIKLLYLFENIVNKVIRCYGFNKPNSIYKNSVRYEEYKQGLYRYVQAFDSISLNKVYDYKDTDVESVYRVFNNSNNIKQDKKDIADIFKEFLQIKITGKKLSDNIEQILTKEKIYKIIIKHQLAEKRKEDKIGVNKYLNASLKKSQRKEGKVDRKSVIKSQLGEEKFKDFSEQKEIFNKVGELVKEYRSCELIKLIKNKKCRDFIDLKEVVNLHYKNIYCIGEFNRESIDKVIIKYINDFAKGRYRKAKKLEIKGNKNLAKLFDDFDKKVEQRIISTIYTTYINNNKYKIFCNDLKKGKKRRGKSVFKEVIKAEDTIRKKISPLISELNFMYFAQFSESDDILGKGNYQEIEKLIKQKDVDNKIDIKSNITLETIKIDEFITKMYAGFELRNHVYHFQKLNKSQIEANKEFDKELENYKKDNENKLANIFLENYKKNIKEYFKSNNVWMLDEQDQIKLIEVVDKAKSNQTYLPRFNKIYNKKINYDNLYLVKNKCLADKLFELNNDFNKITDNKKIVAKNLIRYFYQQYYDCEFYNYANENMNKYEEIVKELKSRNEINIKNKIKDNPLIADFQSAITNCNNLKEIMESIQKKFSSNDKQLRTMLKLNNEVLAILFGNFIKDKYICEGSVKKIVMTLEVADNSKITNSQKICTMMELVDSIINNSDSSAGKFEEILKSAFSNRFTSHLFFISEFLDKRSVANLSNDLTKYSQFLNDLKIRYKVDKFDEVWQEVASKLLEGKFVKTLNIDAYLKSINDLVTLLKEIVGNIDNDRLNLESNNQDTQDYKKNIEGFYGLDSENKLEFDYYITTDTKNGVEKINVLEYNKKIQNVEKEDNDKGGIKDNIVYFDFILNNIYKEKIQFLKEKHMKYIEDKFEDYNEVLKIYSAFRYKKEAKECIDINQIKSIEEIETLKNLKDIIKNYKENSNDNQEFIVYVTNLYQEKYTKKTDFEEINELKVLINNYNFIKNLVYLKSVKNIESFIHQIHSRMNGVYRTIERDYTYLTRYSEDKGMFDKEMSMVYEMLNLNNFIDENLVNNIDDKGDKISNKSNSEIIKKFRNDVAHKNIFQQEKNPNLKDYNKSILNEYNRGKQVTKYDTKLNKAIFEVYIKMMDKKNIVCEGSVKDNIPKLSYKVKTLNYVKNNSTAEFKLMSELEKDYILNFIDFNYE